MQAEMSMCTIASALLHAVCAMLVTNLEPISRRYCCDLDLCIHDLFRQHMSHRRKRLLSSRLKAAKQQAWRQHLHWLQ